MMVEQTSAAILRQFKRHSAHRNILADKIAQIGCLVREVVRSREVRHPIDGLSVVPLPGGKAAGVKTARHRIRRATGPLAIS